MFQQCLMFHSCTMRGMQRKHWETSASSKRPQKSSEHWTHSVVMTHYVRVGSCCSCFLNSHLVLWDWKLPEIALAATGSFHKDCQAQLNAIHIFQHRNVAFTCLGFFLFLFFLNGDNQMAVLQQTYLHWDSCLRVDKTCLSAFIPPHILYLSGILHSQLIRLGFSSDV